MASTIRDVAARAGLSVGTVSKYINGKSFSVAILLPMLDSTFWRRNYKKWRQHQNHYDY